MLLRIHNKKTIIRLTDRIRPLEKLVKRPIAGDNPGVPHNKSPRPVQRLEKGGNRFIYRSAPRLKALFIKIRRRPGRAGQNLFRDVPAGLIPQTLPRKPLVRHHEYPPIGNFANKLTGYIRPMI